MSCYRFHAGVTRNMVVSELALRLENTPYVVAELAYCLDNNPMDFNKFMEGVSSLGQDQKSALRNFCNAVAQSLTLGPPDSLDQF
ncbi:hypothetical protein BMG03_00915 [Thioclava nitratireducens]|uniref:Uncharacterized protein n=1 Tax=Thioclava nitratireducens TaxID=1915078 RepID=A0ABN4XA94_9RHOB|nr:hypothetical protein BMG03_00915 [Thioclava nitratireducens]